MKQIRQKLHKIDCIVEVHDARISFFCIFCLLYICGKVFFVLHMLNGLNDTMQFYNTFCTVKPQYRTLLAFMNQMKLKIILLSAEFYDALWCDIC